MNPSERLFWDTLVTAANADAEFHERCSHLKAMRVVMKVDHQPYTLCFNEGSVSLESNESPSDYDFFISGPLDEWSKLARGEKFYAQATNHIHGKLKGEGDLLKHNWATKALWQLWRVSSRLFQGEATR